MLLYSKTTVLYNFEQGLEKYDATQGEANEGGRVNGTKRSTRTKRPVSLWKTCINLS
jgi:hypothetical protein